MKNQRTRASIYFENRDFYERAREAARTAGLSLSGFIQERLGLIAPSRGGRRAGAGRPKKETAETEALAVPNPIVADYLSIQSR